MKTNLSELIKPNDTVAVAVSGGSDSMALLHYLNSVKNEFKINVIAINVEHGIRGENSVKDTNFVISFCAESGIPLLTYTVDSLSYAKKEKLSVEHAARKLRYDCFFDAIEKGKCDKVATAHHLSDNAESILINLFRGTGLKGVSGITENYDEKIIRPFLSVTKEDINGYVKENSIPFITDETNFSLDYSRNFIRHGVIPKIKEVFPEAEKCLARFAAISKTEDDFLDSAANSAVKIFDKSAEIALPCHPAVLCRAAIKGLRALGMEKDWEKVHADSICALANSESGRRINLPKNLYAVKEYYKIVIYTPSFIPEEAAFNVGTIEFGDYVLTAETIKNPVNLKNGFFADKDKIPADAVIRVKRDGDVFTKFGGGTKSLGDYLTDKKIPLRLRGALPILASGNTVLHVFGVAISDKIKVDGTTDKIIKFTSEKKR